MRNQEAHAVNLELHQRWKKLCDLTPRDDRHAKQIERRKARIGNEVIEANHKMLWKAAQQFASSGATDGTDLYAVAAEQLWRTFQVWDPDRSTLATAAKMHISGAIRREVARTEFTGLSYDQFTLRGNLLKVSKQLQQHTGVIPTFGDIADAAKVPVATVELLLTARESSLDAPVGGSDDPNSATLGELLPEEVYEQTAPEETVLERDTPEMLEKQNAVDVYRYLLGSKASMYRLPHAAVGMLTGGNTRAVHGSVTSVSMEVTVRQSEQLIDRRPTPQELAMTVKVPEAAAAAFLEQREPAE